MDFSPSFYSVVPANVRYATDISGNAKLLYAEITALCQREGYCYASDGYFAQSFTSSRLTGGNVSERTVRRWLKTLVDGGYLDRVLVYDKSGAICGRRLYLPGMIDENLVQYPMDNIVQGCGQKCPQINNSNDTKTDRQNQGDDLIKSIKKETNAGARAEDDDVVLVLEENQAAYDDFNAALYASREDGPNDYVTVQEWNSALCSLQYLADNLVRRKRVWVLGKEMSVSVYLGFVRKALIDGGHDRAIYQAISDVNKRSVRGDVNKYFAYLVSTLWSRI